MTPAQFMASFGAIAEAPEATKKLRELVLTLGVSGRMGTGSPQDGLAVDLLDQIAAQKAALVARKEIKRDKAVAPVDPRSVPFNLPSRWCWARFTGVATIASNLVKPTDYLEYPHVAPDSIEKGTGRLFSYRTVGEDKVRSSKHLFFPGALLYSKIRPNLSKAVLVDFEGLCSADMYPLLSHIDRRYLHLYILSRAFLRQVVVNDNRIAMPKVNQQELSNVLVAVPPLAEQKRIVAKVDQLMAMLDDLEQRQEKTRTVAIHVSKTSLDSLVNAEDPDQLARAWERVSNNFGVIAGRAESIARLRESIGALACSGRLSSTTKNNEGIDEMLEAVQAERRAEGKKSPQLRLLENDDCAYSLPSGWRWVRVGTLLLGSDAGKSPQCEKRPRAGGQYGVLKVSAVSWGSFRPEENKALPEDLKPFVACEVCSGDYLLSRANTGALVARSVVVSNTPSKLLMSDKIVRLHFCAAAAEPRFFSLYNNGPTAREYYLAHASGTSSSMKNVSRNVMLDLPVPLPPLAEQKRIVARVDQLMAMLDHLDKKLDTKQTTSSRIALAVV